MTAKEIFIRFKPAIVRIKSKAGVGTGFIVGEDGQIATNLHVIAGGGTKITVRLVDGAEFQVKRVIAIDPQRDLAVISIDATNLPTLKLGDSDLVSAGDRVVAIGNPLGVLDYTVSDGLISSVRPLDESVTVLQISAPISEGSSGGPLFNPYGEVIGISTFIAVKGQNLNFGVPSNYLLPLINRKGGQTIAAFAAKFERELPRLETIGSIRESAPKHDVSLLDGCSRENLINAFRAISKAIEVGAEVYNRGQHEACFVIYRSAASKLEQDTNQCDGIRRSMTDGLTKASATTDFTQKAWEMRDAFDGLRRVISRRANPNQNRLRNKYRDR